MATVVTWSLSVEELEIGKSVELTASGLGAHEGMAVLIQRPNGSHFLWGVQSDERGRVRDSIKLDSGLGQYLFCPKPACGNVVPTCKPLNVCPCGISRTDCNIKVEGPSQIIKGTRMSYIVSGLAPSKYITVKVSNNQQVSYDVNGISDTLGNFIFEFVHNLAGTYSLVFSDGSCTSHPKIVEVVNSQNEVPILRPANRNPCASSVDLSLHFSKSRYEPGELGHLRASVCNRGPEFRQIDLATSFVVPGGSITSQPIPATLGLSGYRCEEYTVLFTAGTIDDNYTASLFGSYECNGQYYVANGGSTNAIVGAGTGICSAVLQFFGIADGTTEVEVNAEVELEIVVFNAGNKIIDSSSLQGLTLPEHVELVTPLPTNSVAISPNSSQKIHVKVKATEAGSYTIQIPADKLVYACSGQTVPMNHIGYVTLVAS